MAQEQHELSPTDPYFKAIPGGLIAAEDINSMQLDIRKDIGDEIAKAEADIRKTGVDQAGNAQKFDDKSAKQWTDELDQRYAPKIHDHEGQSAYRRFIRRVTGQPGMDKAYLVHKLGRFPLVDIYELVPVCDITKAKDQTNAHLKAGCKVLLYNDREDAENFGLVTQVFRDRIPLGTRIGQFLRELDVEYEDHDSLQDVVNDMWTKLSKDPNDDLEPCTTPWVDDHANQNKTVGDLKSAGTWDDLYIAMRPQKRDTGMQPKQPTSLAPFPINVTHVNYDALLVEVLKISGVPTNQLDLMFLLRD